MVLYTPHPPLDSALLAAGITAIERGAAAVSLQQAASSKRGVTALFEVNSSAHIHVYFNFYGSTVDLSLCETNSSGWKQLHS